MATIAFIGLGAMGLPMADNLIKRQHKVRGFDFRKEALEVHQRNGGIACASAAEAATGAEALVLMVVNGAQAKSALFDAAALDALNPGAVVMLMATCSAADAREIGEKVKASGRKFVDCPVSGGVVGARAGLLTIMAAAPGEDFAAAEPILRVFGDKVFLVGKHWGQGSTVKTLNQLLCGVHIVAAAEAMALAEKAGLDTAMMLKILGNSAAGSWMLNNRGPRMLEAEPEVTSAVDIFVKDLSLVLDAGRAEKVALPLSAAAHQMFLAASGAGHGAADDSQVIRTYRAMNGTEPKS
ncbi:MAG TPA: NAD(P)-dependent oxidoreductase [Beijerinckiaceae bacterium]|nr:NAD(P)-dependent oxidoreductase [Beijerinckiaceae bacterium]